MLLRLFFLLLLVTIALRQWSLGLFSALIMAVLSVCCAAGAMGTYEWVAVHWVAPYWKPSYACAIALAASFGIPLILLRVGTDRLIRRSCLLPSLVDRIGGGVCGVLTAFVLVGVMAHAIQMIPFGSSILGFSRVDVPPQSDPTGEARPTPPDPHAEQSELWLSPDRFAVGLTSMVSAGVFSGDRLLTIDQPDLVEATGWLNAADGQVSRYAPPKSISIVGTERLPYLYHFKREDTRGNVPASYEPKTPTPGGELRMIRVALRREARDENKSHVFTLRQFRLLGHPAGKDDVYEQYFPIAIQQADASQATNRHIQTKWTRFGDWPVINDVYSPRDGNNAEVEIVFELSKGFKPTYLEYKRCARAAVSFDRSAAAPTAVPTPQAPSGEVATAEPTTPEEPARPRRDGRRRRRPRGNDDTVSSSRGGRVRGLTARPGESFFGDEMPIALQAYQNLRNLETSRGAMTSGHLVGYLGEQGRGSNQAITKFAVPPDKRLLQLNTGRLHARSGLGEALSRAATVAQNYIVLDSRGRQYKIIGKYAVATVGARKAIEVQYFPEQVGTVGGLGQFNRIKDRHLKGEYELVMLFLVEPGAEIVSFSTGGSATRQDDLKDANLVAPR